MDTIRDPHRPREPAPPLPDLDSWSAPSTTSAPRDAFGAAAGRHATTIIAHTTDLTGDDRAAFVHAAALAAVSAARLVTVYGTAPAEDATGLPDAAPLALRWRRRIEHWRVCHAYRDDVTETLLDAMRVVAPGLVVSGTHARRGLAAVFQSSVAESLARGLDVPTLVVPNTGRGIVDEATGAIEVRRVLVPAADAATAARGLAASRAFLDLAGIRDAELLLVTVGEHGLEVPVAGDVRGLRASGAIDEAILATAREQEACVIVMPVSGHDDERDIFFGSHTEQIIRRAGRPVLTVPVGIRPAG